MDALKKIFPTAFGVKGSDTSSMIKALVVHIIMFVVASVAIWLVGFLTGWVPLLGSLVGLILKLIGILVDVYAVAGIVIAILCYLNILK